MNKGVIDELTIQQNVLSTEELESWLINKYNEHKQEIERLKKTIDAMIDNEEEYCLEINRLNNIINKAIEYIHHAQNYGTMAQVMPHLKPYVNGNDLLDILKGDDKE